MKSVKHILFGTFAVFASVSMTSCDNLLDINDNPNYPKEVDMAALLPSVCASTIAQQGLNGTLVGSMWLQHTTQGNTTNQYNTTVNYLLTADSYNGFWTNAYAITLPDLKSMVSRAEQFKAWNYWVIGKILTAYNYHMLVDMYEDIPFTEALDVAKYPQPHYDNGKTVVYPALLKMLDEAIAKGPEASAVTATNPVISTKDMYFGGDISKWIAFAKSLKLKIMLRDFETYKSQISTLLAAGGLLDADCAIVAFEDATNKGNPFYEYNIRQLNTTENVRACHTFTEFLLANKDPRIRGIFEITNAAQAKIESGAVLTDEEKYEGLPCGTKPVTSGAGAVPLGNSSRLLQTYKDPAYIMNKAEANFLIAEAYARLNDATSAKKFYDQGVVASFDRWTVSAGKAASFIASGGVYEFKSTSVSDMLNSILTQKWVSYANANALDGVFDRNRTGIPQIDPVHVVRVSNTDRTQGLTPGYVLGTLVVPGASGLQPTEFPRRFLVPNASKQYNINAPTTKSLPTPMWWQVAAGL